MRKSEHDSWMKLAVLTAILMLSTGCGANLSSNSQVQVTNGRQINETDYPSVVAIEAQVTEGLASCTASFVSNSQVISAAHCVEGTNASNPSIYLLKQTIVNGRLQQRRIAKALRWVRDRNYKLADGVNNLDISVITFSRDTALAISEIAEVQPKIGDALTIIGYGNSRNYIDSSGQFSGSGSGFKRIGTNKVAALEDGMIQFVGIPAATEGVPTGTQVLSGSGDSGGPLFINGKLVGITSGGGYGKNEKGENVFISQYVDLTSPSSQATLRSALIRDDF